MTVMMEELATWQKRDCLFCQRDAMRQIGIIGDDVVSIRCCDEQACGVKAITLAEYSVEVAGMKENVKLDEPFALVMARFPNCRWRIDDEGWFVGRLGCCTIKIWHECEVWNGWCSEFGDDRKFVGARLPTLVKHLGRALYDRKILLERVAGQ